MEYLLILIAVIAIFAILRAWSRRKRAAGFQGVNREVNAEVERWFLRLEALADILHAAGEPEDDDDLEPPDADEPLDPAIQSIHDEIQAITATIHRLRDHPESLEYDIPREERRHRQWRESHELKHGPLPPDPVPSSVTEDLS